MASRRKTPAYRQADAEICEKSPSAEGDGWAKLLQDEQHGSPAGQAAG